MTPLSVCILAPCVSEVQVSGSLLCRPMGIPACWHGYLRTCHTPHEAAVPKGTRVAEGVINVAFVLSLLSACYGTHQLEVGSARLCYPL